MVISLVLSKAIKLVKIGVNSGFCNMGGSAASNIPFISVGENEYVHCGKLS